MINTPKYAMECGHVSNALHTEEDGTQIQVCLQCFAIPFIRKEAKTPANLKNRIARCTKSCGAMKPSSPDLSYFHYEKDKEFDSFYNGCEGWN
jgi:hypothetical protein